MKQNKLLNLLQSLAPKEFKDLEDYVKSPFFIKRRTDIPAFYRILKKMYPFDQMESVTKEALFKAVYGKQSFNDKKFRKLLVDFVKIVENYLLFLENEENRFEKDKRLVVIYGKRNIHQEFVRTTNDLSKTLKASSTKDSSYFYNQYVLESGLYFHSNTEKNKGEVEKLKRSIKNFEYFFVLERAKLGIDLKNRERLYSEKHNFSLDDFSSIIPVENIIYKLYFNSLELFNTGKEVTFLELKKTFFEKIDDLGKNEQLIFFKILQNYAIQKSRVEERKYLPILLTFFKIGLSKGMLLDNGMIKSISFINIIVIAIKNDETDWAHSIIKTYKDKILEEAKGFTHKFSTAIIAFYKKEYEKVISILNTISFSNREKHYGFKTLMIRATFKVIPKDVNYYELFSTHCLSFEKYLTRDDIIITKKIAIYLEFIKEIKKVGKLVFQRKLTPSVSIELRNDLEQKTGLLHKNWLIEAIQEISCP